MLSVPSQPSKNQGEHLGEFESRSVKTQHKVEGLNLLENYHKLCKSFHWAMKARITYFIYFIKLLFSVFTKRTQTRQLTILLKSISCFTTQQKYTCKPIKMHIILSKLFINSDKTLVFDQSQHAQGPIDIIKHMTSIKGFY